MGLITSNQKPIFNREKIVKGTLIRARHKNWDQPENGIVSNVSDDMLAVIYVCDLNLSSNYFIILASEVEAGQWDIKWSNDLAAIEEEMSGP